MSKFQLSLKNLGESIKNYFIKGLVTILPIGITVWVFMIIIQFGDSILGGPLASIIGYRIPMLSFALTAIIVLGIGYLTNRLIGKQLMKSVTALFETLPLVREIYLPIREILDQLKKNTSNDFKQVVWVEFPKENYHSIGFITNDEIEILGEKKAAVFIPTTPNPTNGFLVYLSKEDYKELDIPVHAAIKAVISLGVMTPSIHEVSLDKFKEKIIS